MKGTCLCGSVAFEIDGEPTPIELCHCSRCRKAYGSAFAATFCASASAFRWTRGETLVASYDAPIRERPPAYVHVFCKHCGSPLPIVDRAVGYAEIPAGLMDDDPGVRPLRQIHVGRKASWYEPSAALPQHQSCVPTADHLIMRVLRRK